MFNLTKNQRDHTCRKRHACCLCFTRSPQSEFGCHESWRVIWPLYSGLVYVWHYWKPYIVFEKYYQGIYFRSNCLGWFACYRTQFLTGLFKDPFLSSVWMKWIEEWRNEGVHKEGSEEGRTDGKNEGKTTEYINKWLYECVNAGMHPYAWVWEPAQK
jgi:hypothetical protein